MEMILETVLSQTGDAIKILNIVNKNFIENMKKILAIVLYKKIPLYASYIHSEGR